MHDDFVSKRRGDTRRNVSSATLESSLEHNDDDVNNVRSTDTVLSLEHPLALM